MEVILERASSQNRELLFRLLQYSLFEESVTDGNEINAEGLFDYPWFELYFTENDREAYFIKDAGSGALLGFAMINAHVTVGNEGHAIAEFLILPKYRRMGIGSEAARQCFALHKGLWEVSPSYGSNSAMAFWKTVVENAATTYEWKDSAFVLII